MECWNAQSCQAIAILVSPRRSHQPNLISEKQLMPHVFKGSSQPLLLSREVSVLIVVLHYNKMTMGKRLRRLPLVDHLFGMG